MIPFFDMSLFKVYLGFFIVCFLFVVSTKQNVLSRKNVRHEITEIPSDSLVYMYMYVHLVSVLMTYQNMYTRVYPINFALSWFPSSHSS